MYKACGDRSPLRPGSVALGKVCVLYVPSTTQFIDIFAKALSTVAFSKFKASVNVLLSHTPIVGGC